MNGRAYGVNVRGGGGMDWPIQLKCKEVKCFNNMCFFVVSFLVLKLTIINQFNYNF